jgi:hypothetical protein
MKKMMMSFYSLSLFLLLCTFLSTVTFAQTQPDANFVGSNATTMPGGASRLTERIEQLPSLSNIVVMSLVDGIKVSGINIGDTDLTLTLKRQPTANNSASSGNTSLPVTLLVTKLPVNNLTQLISTAESTIRLAQASRSSDPTASIVGAQSLLGGGGAEGSAAAGSDALEILNLLKDVQIGTASIVNANWTAPQTISMGLFGLGNRVAATAPSDFVLVAVIPFQGETNLPTLQLR